GQSCDAVNDHRHHCRDEGQDANARQPRQPARLDARASWDGRVHRIDEAPRTIARQIDRDRVRRSIRPASRPRISGGRSARGTLSGCEGELMPRPISKVAPEWWDYTTLDAELLGEIGRASCRESGGS